MQLDLQYLTTIFAIFGVAIALYIPISRGMKGMEKRLSDDAREREERLANDAKERDERLTREIRAVEERLTREIKAVDERLTREIRAVDERLTHEIRVGSSKTDALISDVGELRGAIGILTADRQREPVEAP